MPTELPIACSLSAADLKKRLAAMSKLGGAALLRTRTSPRHAELRFATGDDVRQRLAAIVAAESECCAFLEMHVADEPDAVVLTIGAPEGAEIVVEDLVGAFATATPRSEAR